MQRLAQAQGGGVAGVGSRPGTPGGGGGTNGDGASVHARLAERTDRLVSRVDNAASQLVARFVTLIQQLELRADEDATGKRPQLPTATAANAALQITAHSAALVRTVEELQRIVREVREAWVLGASSEVVVQETRSKTGQDEEEREEEEVIDPAQVAAYLDAMLDKV